MAPPRVKPAPAPKPHLHPRHPDLRKAGGIHTIHSPTADIEIWTTHDPWPAADRSSRRPSARTLPYCGDNLPSRNTGGCADRPTIDNAPPACLWKLADFVFTPLRRYFLPHNATILEHTLPPTQQPHKWSFWIKTLPLAENRQSPRSFSLAGPPQAGPAHFAYQGSRSWPFQQRGFFPPTHQVTMSEDHQRILVMVQPVRQRPPEQAPLNKPDRPILVGRAVYRSTIPRSS